ncbi:MerR family transcriptional regulator [Sphingobium sp. H33]|uniref:MerR family transcriptional regulator n=1 Tax=Sphingobium nicotianae TaxID=2782607 RepID=A0A9X1DA42_9SPHN|nr:MerR family transcriptional regulator [Sphingobium nicotianae]MBT2186189.1 MerR family transcriptional regulator [Sphingobium nicotianae]
MAKDDGAFLTIGELAQQLGVAQHILRYWETRFPQLRPLQRSGNRRYYRPRDVDVAQQINRLLNDEGFTVRGAQRVLAGRKDGAAPVLVESPPEPAPEASTAATSSGPQAMLPMGDLPVSKPVKSGSPPVAQSDLALLIARLTVIRQNLVDALDRD